METGQPRDPVDESDVLAAIRAVQERELAQLETRLRGERAEELERAMHRFRMHVLAGLIATFRRVMRAEGNPGLETLRGLSSGPPGGAGFFERLAFRPEKTPTREGWPLAAVCIPAPSHTQSMSATQIVAVTPADSWWFGAILDAGTYTTGDPADLDHLDAPGGYLPISPGQEPRALWVRGTTFDQAAVESIAELFVRHDLRWPSG